jgi:hypothetical protein
MQGSSVEVRTRIRCTRSVEKSETCYIPVLVLPTLVLMDGDLNSIAELALENLDCSCFALRVDATCTVVGRCLWETVSLSRAKHDAVSLVVWKHYRHELRPS